MKTYLITSTEYKYNEPDRFIMDDEGNYYGVGEHSYAIIRNFPKSIDYWKNATCSDSDRYFHIEEVELTQDQLEAFDSITKKYIENTKTAPVFGEQYPDGTSKEWKSKKEFNAAADAFIKRYEKWMVDNREACMLYREREHVLSDSRKRMFNSFRKS